MLNFIRNPKIILRKSCDNISATNAGQIQKKMSRPCSICSRSWANRPLKVARRDTVLSYSLGTVGRVSSARSLVQILQTLFGDIEYEFCLVCESIGCRDISNMTRSLNFVLKPHPNESFWRLLMSPDFRFPTSNSLFGSGFVTRCKWH